MTRKLSEYEKSFRNFHLHVSRKHISKNPETEFTIEVYDVDQNTLDGGHPLCMYADLSPYDIGNLMMGKVVKLKIRVDPTMYRRPE